MNPTTFEIQLAVAMVSVVAGLLIWLRISMNSGSKRRMTAMMAQVGLHAGNGFAHGVPINGTISPAQKRCRRCRVEGYCERWLAGNEEGGNRFCANAKLFDLLAEA